MASSTAAAQPVPEDPEDLQEDDDPWHSYAPRADGEGETQAPPPGFSPARGAGRQQQREFAAFEQFLRQRRSSGFRGRRSEQEDDDEDAPPEGRSNAGPPPAWDGTGAFRDYEIRCRLWLATTKVKPKARGPLLLKNLSGTLRRLEAPCQGQFVDGQCHQRRGPPQEDVGEGALRRGRAGGDDQHVGPCDLHPPEEQGRRIQGHSVQLPDEYLGFLLINALQLTQGDIKLMMNYTQGKLTPRVVKEWTRVNESELAWRTGDATAAKKPNAVMHLDQQGPGGEDDEDDIEDEELEILLNAMEQLEEPGDSQIEGDEIFDEEEVKEVLATMVKNYGKGKGKRSFKAVHDAKKAKGLARGYGINRDPSGRFGSRGGPGGVLRTGQPYKVSIELLKQRTRRNACQKVGHWARECPEKDKINAAKETHYL